MINWSSISRQSRIGRVLRRPLAAIPRDATVPILGGPNKGFRWCVGAADHGCWLGSYELAKQRAISRVHMNGGLALDVGANVGFYTLLLARGVGPCGQVLAIEPDRRNAERLASHLALNRIRNVDVIQGAVGMCTGAGTFAPGPTHTTGKLVSSEVGERVDVFALDDLAGHSDKPVPRVIKVDVEGGEANVLAGGERLLSSREPVWFVALHSRAQAAACVATFRRHDYELWSIGQRGELVSYDGSDEDLVAARCSPHDR